MRQRRGDNGDSWRFDVMRHSRPPRTTISVAEEPDDRKAERAEKIKRGAVVVPFGFSRALVEDREARPEREPQTWDGDYT